MPVLSYADGVGLVDGREELFCESVYLLNEDYTVVGKREASAPDAPTPEIGDRFFDHFKASSEERATLKHMRSSISRDSLLMRAGRRPVLMLSGFFSRTRLLVAVVPEGEVRACLEAPGAFADVLEAWHVQLSAEARVPGEPLDGDSYALLSEWLSRVHIPLFFEGYRSDRADADVATIATRLSHLARLCGCRLDYDLSGFGYAPFEADGFDLLIGVAFAVFLMAHRLERDRSVLIKGERLFSDGPVLHVLLHCDASIEALSEIEVLSREAVTRDDLFEVYHHPNGSYPLHLQFSFCNKDLSAQDIKVKRVFETGGHTVLTCSTVDEEIFLAQNGENASKQ